MSYAALQCPYTNKYEHEIIVLLQVGTVHTTCVSALESQSEDPETNISKWDFKYIS